MWSIRHCHWNLLIPNFEDSLQMKLDKSKAASTWTRREKHERRTLFGISTMAEGVSSAFDPSIYSLWCELRIMMRMKSIRKKIGLRYHVKCNPRRGNILRPTLFRCKITDSFRPSLTIRKMEEKTLRFLLNRWNGDLNSSSFLRISPGISISIGGNKIKYTL